ncbi:hypothetical protein B0H19DRAFT_1082932 [Mycena capillaripes]|nr:hypothetical protein B0H19DRAFT_1082932 [Mycena capillaripes]
MGSVLARHPRSTAKAGYSVNKDNSPREEGPATVQIRGLRDQIFGVKVGQITVRSARKVLPQPSAAAFEKVKRRVRSEGADKQLPPPRLPKFVDTVSAVATERPQEMEAPPFISLSEHGDSRIAHELTHSPNFGEFAVVERAGQSPFRASGEMLREPELRQRRVNYLINGRGVLVAFKATVDLLQAVQMNRDIKMLNCLITANESSSQSGRAGSNGIIKCLIIFRNSRITGARAFEDSDPMGAIELMRLTEDQQGGIRVIHRPAKGTAIRNWIKLAAPAPDANLIACQLDGTLHRMSPFRDHRRSSSRNVREVF